MSKQLIFHCPVVSPHHLSFMPQVVERLGEGEVLYVHTIPLVEERRKLGWADEKREWIKFDDHGKEIQNELATCKVLISAIRDIDLFERRAAANLLTIYMSERWFKPIPVASLLVTGALRLLSPAYLRMAIRFRRLLKSDKPFYYFPMSWWAAKDMVRICGWHGAVRFEHSAAGKVWAGSRALDKFKMWAYFVSSSGSGVDAPKSDGPLRVLWLGRLVKVKRVADIVEAVRLLSEKGVRVLLDIYGHGDDESHVKKVARGMQNVSFFDPVPIAKVRDIMRAHDVYVLSSNAMEGWGAVVNEAMEEGMRVVGTYEAGASSTLLPESCLYHAGDVAALARLLSSEIPKVGIGGWSCQRAADEIVRIVQTNQF